MDREILRAYGQWEFDKLDKNDDGVLDYEEYKEAPLSLPSPSEFIPDCERWAFAKKSMAPIEHPDVFACSAEDGELKLEDAGKLVEIINSGEVRDIMARYDQDDDAFLSAEEYRGLPEPEVNILGTDQLGRDC